MGNENTVENSTMESVSLRADGKEYDILAYFADFTYYSCDPALYETQPPFFNVIINDGKLPPQSNSGAASQVFVMTSTTFSELQVGVVDIFTGLIALKRRFFKGNSYQAPKEWKPLQSLCTELRILTDRTIRAHPNIVDSLGNCWGYADKTHTLILPVIILEATELGDLQIYHDRHHDLTLGRQLQLGIGVARGVAALHEAGIIHCDIKPKNVLVFPHEDPNCPVIPKLIDFDLAIFYHELPDRVLPPQGTRAWQSPEQTKDRVLVEKKDLFRIDTFSLGMLLLNLLTSNALSKYMSDLERGEHRLESGVFDSEKFKRTGLLALNTLAFLAYYANIGGPGRNKPENSGLFREVWMRAARILTRALAGDIRHRASSAVEVERELQAIFQTIADAELLEYHSKELLPPVAISPSIIIPSSGSGRVEFSRWVGSYDAGKVTYEPCQSLGVPHIPSFLDSTDSTTASEIRSFFEKLHHEEPPHMPSREPRTSPRDDVVKFSQYMGILDLFPPELLSDILESLKRVYNSPRQSSARRAEAAFQYSIASVALRINRGHRDDDPELIDEAMDMLQFAAGHDHSNAQRLRRWMESILRPSRRQKPPCPREIDGLKTGVLQGSRMARIQLRRHDPTAYDEVLHILRTKKRGMGGARWSSVELHHMCPWHQWLGSIWHHASAGNVKEVADALPYMRERGMTELLINARIFEDQSTPLIEACRSGHAAIVHLLVEHGADASLRDSCDVGPLHFLSSFEPSEMLPIATALISRGCGLETWSSGAVSFDDERDAGDDIVYGVFDGTPLLWAVAAGSAEAVDVLLSLKADPFARDGPGKIKSQSRLGVFYSPVLWAAHAHQAELLELLLRDFPPEKVGSSLDSHPQTMHGGSKQISPLGLACQYTGGKVYPRMLLHGPEHMEKCAKTIHMLLDMGSSPDRVMSLALLGTPTPIHVSALAMACGGGQPYALQALLSWNDGILSPQFTEWAEMLGYVAARDDRALFDELLRINVAPTQRQEWVELIALTAKMSKNKSYLHAVISKHQDHDASLAPFDYTIEFANALVHGCPQNARVIYERADKVDVNFVCESGESNDMTYSILGRLIKKAKLNPNEIPAVKTFLDVTSGHDSVFEGVMTAGGGEVFNALEASILYGNGFYPNLVSTGVDLLAELLRRFNHPTKHLAHRHGSTGNSLLHLAVIEGNDAALDLLLDVDGLDFDARDCENLTPFDRCLARWQDSSRDALVTAINATGAGKETWWLHSQWEHTTERMMRSLERRGASKYGDIVLLVKRIKPSSLLRIEILAGGKVHMQTIDAAASVVDKERFHQYEEEVAKLAVGECSIWGPS